MIILAIIQTYNKRFKGYIALALISLCTLYNAHTSNGILFAYMTQEPESETRQALSATQQTIDALREEAVSVAVQLTKDYPNNADAVFRLGNVYRNQGNSAMATKCFEDCLKLNPEHAGAYYDMAWIAFQKAEYKKSVDLWHKVLRIDPKQQGAYRFLASALICLGKTEEAITALKKDIEISGKTADSYSLLGNQYLLLNEYTKAKSCFEMVIKMQPAYTSAYYGLAITCERLGQKDKFKKYIEKFRKLKDNEMIGLKKRDKAFDDLVSLCQSVAQTHTSIAKYYYTRGNPQRAEALLRRAATLDPRHTGCRILLTTLYLQDGRIAQALPLHEQLSYIEPDNVVHHVNVGILSSQLQKTNRAEEAFKQAIKCAPKQSIGYRELARLYLTTNQKLPDARKLTEQAVKLEATAENYSILGWAYYVNGETAKAISAAKRAAELEPDNINYRQIYEDIKKEN